LKKIFVSSPLGFIDDRVVTDAELDDNIKYAEACCRQVAEEGHIPYAPHVYFTRFLNDRDPEERKRGMEMGLQWLAECDEMRVYGNYLSPGMKTEIEWWMNNKSLTKLTYVQ
jgi:hypothetical protein